MKYQSGKYTVDNSDEEPSQLRVSCTKCFMRWIAHLGYDPERYDIVRELTVNRIAVSHSNHQCDRQILINISMNPIIEDILT